MSSVSFERKFEHKLSALVIADKEVVVDAIKSLISAVGECKIDTTDDKLAAIDMARDNGYDFIVINSPFKCELADDIALSVLRVTFSAVILLSPEEISSKLSEKLSKHGVFIMTKPVRKADFTVCCNAAVVSSIRSRNLFEENEKLKRKMRDVKTVERAKVLLVEYLKLSEKQAHKYIEQQAMELRKTRGEVALSIIGTYES